MNKKVLQIKVALLKDGFSVSEWARENGFKQQTVDSVLKKWAGRNGSIPRGKITRAILQKLTQDLGIKINPSI